MTTLGAGTRPVGAWLTAPTLVISMVALSVAQEAPPHPGPGRRLDTDPAGAGVHSSCLPRIAATANHLHVVWQDARDTEWAIRYRRGDAAGGSWEAQDVRLSPVGAHAVEPRIVASESCVHVVWRTVGAANGADEENVCAISSLDDGATWSGATRFATGPSARSDFVGAPELAATGMGGACVVWIEAIGDRDHALLAVHHGRGSSWPERPTILDEASRNPAAERNHRCALPRVAGCSGRVGVIYLEMAEGAPAELVFHGSVDDGRSFPESLTTNLQHGTAATTLALATNANGVVHVVWPDVDPATGGAQLLAQRSCRFGAAGSWLERPVRVDDAKAQRARFVDASVAVDADGGAVAVYTASRPEHRDGLPSAVEIVANASASTEPSTETWPNERVVASDLRRGLVHSIPVLSRVRVVADGGRRAAAIAWVEEPAANDSHARLWIGATADGGSSWCTRALDVVTEANAPRADHPDLLLRRAGDASVHAALVWDDRRFFSAPGSAPSSGSGAPESCFLELELPCTPPRSH